MAGLGSATFETSPASNAEIGTVVGPTLVDATSAARSLGQMWEGGRSWGPRPALSVPLGSRHRRFYICWRSRHFRSLSTLWTVGIALTMTGQTERSDLKELRKSLDTTQSVAAIEANSVETATGATDVDEKKDSTSVEETRGDEKRYLTGIKLALVFLYAQSTFICA